MPHSRGEHMASSHHPQVTPVGLSVLTWPLACCSHQGRSTSGSSNWLNLTKYRMLLMFAVVNQRQTVERFHNSPFVGGFTGSMCRPCVHGKDSPLDVAQYQRYEPSSAMVPVGFLCSWLFDLPGHYFHCFHSITPKSFF